jgi:integrase/recombinase XerD
MSALRQSLADYPSLRRSLGYSLQRPEKLLGQFIDYLDACGASTVTAEHALAWARLPESSDPSWWAHRLTVVRGFAGYLHALDEANEVPPTDVLVWKSHRANPFIYADDEITALIGAAATLSSPLRVVTYQTLIGLLATTGMRIGEAIDLDVDDFDADNGILLVRRGKGGATRQLPLHPSTTTAVHRYLHHPARQAGPRNGALLISPAGTRLLYCNVQWTFQKLLHHTGIQPRSRTCRPRIHDLRHTLAVTALLDAYRDGLDIDRRLTLLATYLGHTSPAGTYWYLSATPQLLAAALDRLDRNRSELQ